MGKKFLTILGFISALSVIWTLAAGSFSCAGAANSSPSILFVTWEAEVGITRPWKQDLIDAGYQVKAVQRSKALHLRAAEGQRGDDQVLQPFRPVMDQAVALGQIHRPYGETVGSHSHRESTAI